LLPFFMPCGILLLSL